MDANNIKEAKDSEIQEDLEAYTISDIEWEPDEIMYDIKNDVYIYDPFSEDTDCCEATSRLKPRKARHLVLLINPDDCF
jgi:hypothetical protein